ncbi:MAG: alpha/beta hydrolase [Polyangiaceae bacterium]
MRRRSLVFTAIFMLASGACTLGARATSRALTFRGADLAPPTADLAGVVEHSLVARDGVPVHALEVPAADAETTVVWFHNNRETAEQQLGLARGLSARGLDVLVVEYRGYGRSRGVEPSEEGLYADAEAAFDLLDARGTGPEHVVIFGQSLGTGVAAEMAKRGRGAGLVLVTPFTSIPGLVEDRAPPVPARWLVPDAFDTLSKAREIRVPTLVIHGDADEIVPFWMGERISETIVDCALVRLPGGHHGDLFGRDGEHLLDEIAALAKRAVSAVDRGAR